MDCDLDLWPRMWSVSYTWLNYMGNLHKVHINFLMLFVVDWSYRGRHKTDRQTDKVHCVMCPAIEGEPHVNCVVICRISGFQLTAAVSALTRDGILPAFHRDCTLRSSFVAGHWHFMLVLDLIQILLTKLMYHVSAVATFIRIFAAYPWRQHHVNRPMMLPVHVSSIIG